MDSNSWHSVASQLIKLSPMLVWDEVPTEACALKGQVAAAFYLMVVLMIIRTLVSCRIFSVPLSACEERWQAQLRS